MNSITVYLDEVLVFNFLMDYLLLWVAGKLARLNAAPWRLAAGAVLGAVYAVLVLWPEPSILWSPWAKVIVSLFMIGAAFGRRRRKPWEYLRGVSCFYLAAFILGGAAWGFMGMTGASSPVMAAVGGGIVLVTGGGIFQWVLAGAAATVIFSQVIFPNLRSNALRSRLQIPVVICLGEHRVPVKALVDTGNRLRDPLTQMPVMVVEHQAVAKLMPAELNSVLAGQEELDTEKISQALSGTLWASRIRLIPFNSLGKESGLLMGFRPDSIILVSNGRMVKVKDLVVAVYRKPLSPQGEYRALLPPDLLDIAS